MNACFAMRLQTAASSFVVVIGSIPAYYRSRALLSRLTMGSRHTFSVAGGNGLMFCKRTSIVRYLIVLSSFLMISLSCHAAGITDATGRTVAIPDRVERIMAAGPNAAVILSVLAPKERIANRKMVSARASLLAI